MNPSPSGFFNFPGSADSGNNPMAMHRYMNRISGPLLDRIDIHLEVNPVPFDEISSNRQGETSAQIRKRVVAARELQLKRFDAEVGVHSNAQVGPRLIRRYGTLKDRAQKPTQKGDGTPRTFSTCLRSDFKSSTDNRGVPISVELITEKHL